MQRPLPLPPLSPHPEAANKACVWPTTRPTSTLNGRPRPMRCAVPFLFTPPIDMQHAPRMHDAVAEAHLLGLHAPLRSHWAPLSPSALCFLLRRASDAVSLPSFLCSCLTSDNSITPFIRARSLARSAGGGRPWRARCSGPVTRHICRGPASSRREMEINA